MQAAGLPFGQNIMPDATGSFAFSIIVSFVISLTKLMVVDKDDAVAIWKMPSDVSELMKEAEPEVAEAIVPDRHSNNRGLHLATQNS